MFNNELLGTYSFQINELVFSVIIPKAIMDWDKLVHKLIILLFK